jgi:hypothetical protein
MHETSKIKQTLLSRTRATMYPVCSPALTRLTCRYPGHLCRESANFSKRAPRVSNELYLFVGDVPVSGRVSPQHVTPYVQCAGYRGGQGDFPVPPNRRQVRPMGYRQSHRPAGIPSPTWPTESIRSGSRPEAMSAGAWR